MTFKSPLPSLLIVEDDAKFCAPVVLYLEERGYRVLVAHRSGDAIKKLRNQKFDCILADIRLENSSGASIITSIRGDKKDLNYSTPIVVMSGYLEPHLVRELMAMVQGFLVKPFELSLLDRKLQVALMTHVP